jgi:tetratricopeptide (TPR) repeat protein
MAGVFISLTSEDAPLGDALKHALTALLGESVPVNYSTSKELGRAPRAGGDWFAWIVDQVRGCDFCLVLLTPNSVQKPWLLWEAGAVYSAAIASGGKPEKVRPLLFHVTEKQLPTPFRDTTIQYQRGDDDAEIRKVFREIREEYARPGSPVPWARLDKGAEGINGIVTAYLNDVRAILLRAATTPTDVAIQEWLERLEALVAQNRRSEVEHLQDWMEIAFGRTGDERSRPIDLRLHSRLAEAYLKSRDYERAVQQLELGRQIAPRDIFILRTLGRALLDKQEPEAAEKVIAYIAELDASSFERNAECAALLARLHRVRKRSEQAIVVLERAWERNRESYYLANLLGEACLESRNADGARRWFQEALEIIGTLREENVWVFATAANAAFVLGDDARAVDYVTRINGKKPDDDSLKTIVRGLRGVAERVGGERRLDPLLDILLPERAAAKQPAQADARA